MEDVDVVVIMIMDITTIIMLIIIANVEMLVSVMRKNLADVDIISIVLKLGFLKRQLCIVQTVFFIILEMFIFYHLRKKSKKSDFLFLFLF